MEHHFLVNKNIIVGMEDHVTEKRYIKMRMKYRLVGMRYFLLEIEY